MNDIDFARDNAGKEYIYNGYKVKVVGYDCTGVGDSVIVSGFPWGWRTLSSCDVILVKMDPKTDQFYYVSMDKLNEIEKYKNDK